MHTNLIWDASVSAAPADFKSAITYASHQLDTLIKDPFTENIAVGWGEIGGKTLVPGDLAEGGPLGGGFLSYEQVVAHLAIHANTPAERQEIASLPDKAPANIPYYYVANAQLKAWGLMDPNGTEIDGQVGFSSNYAYTFDPSHRAVAGKYDLIGAAMHEMTHAEGRIYSDGPLELVNFSAPGVFAQPNTGGYFSTDGGKTNLGDFAPAPGDTSDWKQSGDSFNYITNPGVQNDLSAKDITFMGTLGFDVASAHHHGCCHHRMRFIADNDDQHVKLRHAA